MIRLISSRRCFLASSGLNGCDIHCGDQNATHSFFIHSINLAVARACTRDTIGIAKL